MSQLNVMRYYVGQRLYDALAIACKGSLLYGKMYTVDVEISIGIFEATIWANELPGQMNCAQLSFTPDRIRKSWIFAGCFLFLDALYTLYSNLFLFIGISLL
jgi:hypothetical protein